MNDQIGPNPEDRRDQLEILLAEYKCRNDEIFKAMSFRAQAVVGYLGVLSALAAIVLRGETRGWEREIFVALAWVSAALVHILFQYEFMMRSNTYYIVKHLRPCAEKLLSGCEMFAWEDCNARFRDKFGKLIVRLTKKHAELVPQAATVLAAIVGFVAFVCGDCFCLFGIIACNNQCAKFLWWLILFLPPITAMAFQLLASKRLSDSLKEASRAGAPPR